MTDIREKILKAHMHLTRKKHLNTTNIEEIKKLLLDLYDNYTILNTDNLSSKVKVTRCLDGLRTIIVNCRLNAEKNAAYSYDIYRRTDLLEKEEFCKWLEKECNKED